jgi:3-methyl-2-oxobutanoate hydroxymethyltransferase
MKSGRKKSRPDTDAMSKTDDSMESANKTQNKFFTNSSYDKVTVSQILEMKKRKEKAAFVTAYDYSNALICDRAGVDGVLVGDSAAMVMLGYHDTTRIGMQEMLVFCGGVCRAIRRALIIADMPFGSYQGSVTNAIHNAVLLIKAGCNAVKIEGGEEVVPLIRSIVAAGIPVMGHIGFTPQTSPMWKNYRLHGRTLDSALKLIEDAKKLEEAGAFSVVLEMVTDEVATIISQDLSIPTIGIGSGLNCDGQVLVSYDLLGLYESARLKFVKRYAQLSKTILNAISQYSKDVKDKKFPQDANSFHMDKDELNKVLMTLKKGRMS